jgi:uncharacterized repeat protein (TIGR02543 family)
LIKFINFWKEVYVVRKKFTSMASLLTVIVFMVFIVFIKNESLVSANIVSTPVHVVEDANHYIQMTESNISGNLGPYLIITYSEITNLVVTGVTNDYAYRTNVTPQFNVGTATLNGSLFTSGTTVTAEGSYTLVVTSGGQQETIQFRIDKTRPTASVLINNGSLFTNSQYVNVKITPDPDVNDIVSMRYSINESTISTTQQYHSEFSIGVGSENGEKSVRVELIDAAGNISPLYFWDFALNTTIPTGTLTINSGAIFTTEQEVDLLITPNAGANEIVSMRFSTDNSNWSSAEGYNPGKRYTLPAGDGNKTVYVQLIDRYGNIGVIQRSILLDMNPPTATVLINNGDDITSEAEVTLNFTLGAGVTDVVSVQFSNDNLTWSVEEAYSASMNYTLPAGDGIKTVYVRFIDHAGNVGFSQDSIILDTTPPIKYSVTYNENGATGGLVPIDSQTYENGNSVIVANNTGSLVKTGATFNGWNINADGSGTSYAANDTFNISAANVILYAAWNNNRYILTFESNEGSVVATQNKSYNETASEPSAPTKSGYTFGGWYKETTLANQWNFTKDLVTANITLYAKWVDNSSSGNNGGGYIPTSPQNSFSDPTTNTSPAPKPSQEPEPTPDVPKPVLPVVTFDDLSGHWAKGMIEELASQGIIMGYPDGSFHPNESIERQHMAQIFMRAFKLEPTREVASFSDVSPNNPYYEAITLLQQAGIVEGSNGIFNPNASLTRAQMAKIVALALGIEPGETGTFQDVPPTHWGYAYIASLAELEIVVGDNGKFKPDEPVTRAQFVAMMYRALKLVK